ncbi:MAG: uracil-DNA glycosylase [Clostridia bacterium]
MIRIGNDWDELLKDEFASENYKAIHEFLKTEYQTQTAFPPMDDIFNAFKLTAFQDVSVVILGQDPYHEIGQAHGLSFSVKGDTPLPPSLKNIFKELQSDLGIPISQKGDLTAWAKQGVMLLNTTLTVREHVANSHSNIGWTKFTDDVITLLNKKTTPLVFILWGNNARSKKSLINTSFHHVIESAHPSPLSAYNGFFGSKPFSKCNEFLAQQGKTINWQL